MHTRGSRDDTVGKPGGVGGRRDGATRTDAQECCTLQSIQHATIRPHKPQNIARLWRAHIRRRKKNVYIPPVRGTRARSGSTARAVACARAADVRRSGESLPRPIFRTLRRQPNEDARTTCCTSRADALFIVLASSSRARVRGLQTHTHTT